MRPPKAQLALAAAAAALLGAPASTVAADVVPPQNSAANQYTETYPTASGDRETRRADDVGGGNGGRGTNGGAGAKLDPAQERGLEAAGSDGRAVVDLVEETAPPAATQTPTASAQTGTGSRGDMPSEQRPSTETPGVGLQVSDEDPSGTGEVLGQMTGVSASGELGPLLPLLVLVTLTWAAGYFWRRRSEAV